MLPLDFSASESQYADHLFDIWFALDPEERGTWWVRQDLMLYATSRGVDPEHVRHGHPTVNGQPIVVASFQDSRACRRPFIYVEHGAGQTYDGDPVGCAHPSYAGSVEHEDCILFLCPNEQIARRWRDRYPDAPAITIGSPRLDRWTKVDDRRTGETVPRWPHKPETPRVRLPGSATEGRTSPSIVAKPSARGFDPPLVCVSFHADIRLINETTSAWEHFRGHVPGLAQHFRLFGHAHPRWGDRLRRWWEMNGIEFEPSFEAVMDRADCYVIDNSSTGVEFAVTGKPIVWLSAPWYRRDVHHGGRFWDWTVDVPHCEDPADLAAAISTALADYPEHRLGRQRMVDSVFPPWTRDGRAAQRAAVAIREAVVTGAYGGAL